MNTTLYLPWNLVNGKITFIKRYKLDQYKYAYVVRILNVKFLGIFASFTWL